MIAVLRWAHSDQVDYAQLGAAHARRYAASLDRLAVDMKRGALPGARIYHGRYADFLDDPVGATGRLYARFGRPFSADLQRAMREFLGDNDMMAYLAMMAIRLMAEALNIAVYYPH